MIYHLPFAELLERRSDDTPALHHTVSAHPDISQVSSDDAVIHDDGLEEESLITTSITSMFYSFNSLFCLYLPVQDDVLTPAQNRLSAHFVP